MFVQLFLTILVCYHVSFIIVESTFPLFSWLRNLDNWIGKLFNCILCVSVWVGCIASVLFFDFASEIGFERYAWFSSGIFYSFWTWVIYQIMVRFEV